MTIEELLAQVKSVHRMSNAWFAYVPWAGVTNFDNSTCAVGRGATPREAMENAIIKSKGPRADLRVLPTDSFKTVVDKVVRQDVPASCDDLF